MSAPRLIVTRPAAQAGPAVAQLSARGIDAVAVPLIEIEAVADGAPIVAAWSSLAAVRLVLFVSANAVVHFFAARPAGTPWPAATLAGAPGPGTADALRAAGLGSASIVAPHDDAGQFDSEALWQRLRLFDWHGAGVVVVRGAAGRDWLGDQLGGAGAAVTTCVAYRRTVPSLADAALRIVDSAVQRPDGWLWLFSSSEAIGNLESIAGAGRWAASRALATHPRIAERARQAGFAEVREVAPGVDAVVACIQSLRP